MNVKTATVKEIIASDVVKQERETLVKTIAAGERLNSVLLTQKMGELSTGGASLKAQEDISREVGWM